MRSRASRFAGLLRGLSQPLVDLLQVVVANELAEVVVVEDLLEDLAVGVHPGDDRGHELAVEREREVLDAVALGLVGELAVRDPVGLELVEQQLVGVGEVGPEPVVELLDDARQRLELELLLAALPAAEERPDLADALTSSASEPLVGQLVAQVGQLDLGAEVEPLDGAGVAQVERRARGRRRSRARASGR